MPTLKISKFLNHHIYFLTLSVKNLYYFFDRQYRWNILARSLQYCQTNKELKLFAFVFMINHIHLIVSSPDVAGFVRDFKKFTSKKFHQNIQMTEPNVLKLFLASQGYEFWGKTNMPKLIATEEFFRNKLEYIYNNPVKKQYVMRPEQWYWSSANPFCELKSIPIKNM